MNERDVRRRLRVFKIGLIVNDKAVLVTQSRPVLKGQKSAANIPLGTWDRVNKTWLGPNGSQPCNNWESLYQIVAALPAARSDEALGYNRAHYPEAQNSTKEFRSRGRHIKRKPFLED